MVSPVRLMKVGVCCCLFGLLGLGGARAAELAGNTGEILVRLRPGRAASSLGASARRLKADALPRWVKVLPEPGETMDQALARLRQTSGVEVAQPNYIYRAHAVPNDPSYADQWALPAVNLPALWDTTTGASDVVVAVLDTGLNLNLQDFAGVLALNAAESASNGVDDDNNGRVDDFVGWDFVSNDNDPTDDDGHGTFVAGVAAALRNNGVGVAGAAGGSGAGPGVKLLPVKVLGSNGAGSAEDIIAGLAYAVGRGARVINMSLGQLLPDTALEEAVQNAKASGVVLVASAGNGDANGNPLAVEYPAAYDEVLAVGALSDSTQRVVWSNRGPALDLMAPGVEIAGIDMSGQVIHRQGTSFAAPLVAAVAALLRSLNPSLPVDTLMTILKQGAVDLGEAGVDNNYGYGRLDALAALNLLMQDSLPPTFVSSLPVNNSLSKERSVYVLSAQDDRSGVDLGTSSLSLLREGAPLSGSVLGQFGGVLRLTLGTPIPAGPASDGLYQLRATLKDRTGNTTTQDVFFTLDSTAPELTLNPVPAVVGESGLILAGSLSDTNGVSLSINGVPVTSLPGAFTHPVTLAPGGNQLSVQLTDPVGNTTQQTVAVAWDNQGPALPTFYPPLGGFAASLSTTVGARVTDAFSAVDFSASVLLVNGESCGPLLQTGDLLTCAPGGPLPKGQSRAELTVRDEWGNETFEDWTFIVDPDPPVLTLGTVPAATRNDTVLVSGTVQEDNLLSLTVGGAPATLAAGQFLYTATLVAGGNVLDVIATDKAGNVATLPLTVIKDNTPPMLVLNTPATDMTTNQAALVVSGLTDASLVTVGGVVASLSGGQFSLSKTLAEGPNTISVAAHDAAGNVTLITRQVTLDTTAPTFTQPLPQALTTRNSPLPLTVFAEGATQVEAGGLLFAVVGGQANLSLPVAEGLNQFTVTARDTAGNKLPVPLTVLRLSSGNTPTPQLIWSSQPAATSASSVVVMAVAVGVGVDPAFAIGGAPALAAQVTPTDQCAPDPCPGVTVWLFSASVVLQEGANLIPVTTGAATPPAQTLAITRDTQPPALGSLSPGFGAVVKGPVTLTGQTEAGATLSWLYGLTTTGTSGIFNLPLPPDVLAVNTSLLLTDTLGNQAALPVVFAVDNTPPAVLAVSPASGSMVGAGVVRVSVTCEGCTRVTYLSKSATVTAGVAELDVVLPQSQVDSPIEVTDEAGNVTTVPYLLLREVLTGDTTLALSAGWNLVSLGETSLAQLGVELGPGAWVLAYDPLTGYTVPGGMAQASRGYFVLLPQGGTVHVDLPAELVAKTVALAPGWNLAAFSYLGQGAGLSSENLTVQQGENVMPLAQAMQQGLVSGLFSFNGSGYDENAPMNWLSGFWIFAESALSLSAP